MTWESVSIMSQKEEFVTLASKEGANISELSRRFAISRPTAYKWLARYRQHGMEGLHEKSRKPAKSPHATDEKALRPILDLRQKHPAWGACKLKRYLANEGRGDLPALSTICAILARNGRIDKTLSHAHTPFLRYEKGTPNQLWQMDFKGHIPMRRGGRCHPLTVLDDHSRYLVGLKACDNERMETVRGHLRSIFAIHGLPEAILCDNGSPWGCPSSEFTELEIWLMRMGVKMLHGRPGHPQTQGKDERFHRTLKAELLSRNDWLDIKSAQPLMDAYRELYNTRRPHQALDMQTPASRYRVSDRAMPRELPPLYYAPGETLRTVKSKGEITFHNRFYYIGQACAGLTVALREILPEGTFNVCLGALPLGYIDLKLPTDRPKGNYFPLIKCRDNPLYKV
jgi:transposase InsO family protein